MEGVVLLLLLFGGCTAALTSHIVSPIVVAILLVSATLRRKATPFFRIGIITGLMLLGSYSVTSNSSPPLFSFITYHSTGEVEGFREYSVLATLSFIIMGIQIGFILPSKPAITKTWLDVVGHSVFWNFSVGYLVWGFIYNNLDNYTILHIWAIFNPCFGNRPNKIVFGLLSASLKSKTTITGSPLLPNCEINVS